MPVNKEQETTFNKALRMVMAEYDIQGTDLAKISGVSENAISRARKKAVIKSDTISKISEALASINIDAYKKFWILSSGYEDLFKNQGFTDRINISQKYKEPPKKTMKVAEKRGEYKF